MIALAGVYPRTTSYNEIAMFLQRLMQSLLENVTVHLMARTFRTGCVIQVGQCRLSLDI